MIESFLNKKEEVLNILTEIGSAEHEMVRLFEAPASYYKMRKLEDAGLVEHKEMPVGAGKRPNQVVLGFALTRQSKQMLTKHKRSIEAERTAKEAEKASKKEGRQNRARAKKAGGNQQIAA